MSVENKAISKALLVSVLKDWGEERISSDELQLWMVDHYDPPEVKVGEGESEYVQEAMNIVMNEYELSKTDKYVKARYHLALDFLACDTANFAALRKSFIRDAFID